MAKRIVLTAREIQAVLAVAGNALAEETFEDAPDLTAAQQEVMVHAYESGMGKLRLMLAGRGCRNINSLRTR